MASLLDTVIANSRKAKLAAKSIDKTNSLSEFNVAIKKASLVRNADYKNKQLQIAADQEAIAEAVLYTRSRSASQVIGDTAIDVGGKGIAIGLPELAYGTVKAFEEQNPLNIVSKSLNFLKGDGFQYDNPYTIDKMVENLGIDPLAPKFAAGREYFSEAQSNELQANFRKASKDSSKRSAEAEADLAINGNTFLDRTFSQVGLGYESAKDYLDNPAILGSTVAESLPQMLVPGGISKNIAKGVIKKAGKESVSATFNRTKLAREAFKKEIPEGKIGKNWRRTPEGKQVLAKLKAEAADVGSAKFVNSTKGKKILNDISERTGVGYTALAEGASNAVGVQGEILIASESDLRESSDAYNELRAKNKTHEEARKILADQAFNETFAIAGLIGLVSSKYTGTGKLEGNLFKEGTKLGDNIISKSLLGGTKEFTEELFQGGGGQLAGNIAKSRTSNTNQDILEGVGDSAGIGAVAGFASGAGLTGLASIPGSLDTGVTGAAKYAAKKLRDKAGISDDLANAFAAGNVEDIINKPAKTTQDKEDVVNALLGTIPKDPTASAEHANKLAYALISLKRASTDKDDPALNKRIAKYGSQIRGMLQQKVKAANEATAEFVNDLPDKPNKDTKGKIDEAINTFGSRPPISKAVADKTVSEAQAILDSGLATEEQASILNDTIKVAKLFDEVTQDVFIGSTVDEKFKGISFYLNDISTSLSNDDVELAQYNLDALEKFTKSHEEKLTQFEEALPAWNKRENGGELSQQETAAIKTLEARPSENGKGTFKIQSGSFKLMRQITSEVAALQAATTQANNLVKAGSTVAKVDGSTLESDSTTEQSAVVEPEANIASDTTQTTLENTTVESTQEVANEGDSLLKQAQDANLSIPRAVRNNPNHRKSIKILKDKLASNTEKEAAPAVAKEKSTDVLTKVDSTPQVENTPEVNTLDDSSAANKERTQNKDNDSSGAVSTVDDIKYITGKGKKELSKLGELVDKQFRRIAAANRDTKGERKQAIIDDANIKKDIALENYDNAVTKYTKISDAKDKVTKLKEQKAKVASNDANRILSPLKNGENDTSVDNAIAALTKIFNKSNYKGKEFAKAVKQIVKAVKDVSEGSINNNSTDANYLIGLNLAKNFDLFEEYSLAESIIENSANTKTRVFGKGVNKGKVDNVGGDKILSKFFKAVKSNKGNLLQNVSNLFSKGKKNINVFGKLNADQQAAIPLLQNFTRAFNNILFNKVIDLRSTEFSFQDTFQYFIKPGADSTNIKQYIEENLISAMSMASLNWIATGGGDTVSNNKSDINGILLRDSKIPVIDSEVHFLGKAGTLQKNVVTSIGKEVMRVLGIEAKDDAVGEAESNLVNALGNMAVATMLAGDLITLTTISTDMLNHFNSDKASATLSQLSNAKNYTVNVASNASDSVTNSALLKAVTDPKVWDTVTIVYAPVGKGKAKKVIKHFDGDSWIVSSSATTGYLRVATKPHPKYENQQAPSDRVDKLIEGISDSDGVINALFGIESRLILPSAKPPEKVVSKIKGSFLSVPAKLSKLLGKVQQYAYKFDNRMFEVQANMDDETILKIAGYDFDYLDDAHKESIPGIEAKNADILRKFEMLRDFKAKHGNNPFYFAQDVWTNMRMGLQANTVNPQADKYHRAMLGMAAHEVTVDPKNAKQMRNFFLGIAQGLNLPIDKLSQDASLDTLNSAIIDSPIFDAAIKAIQDGNNSEAIVKAVTLYKNKTHTLSALVAYADYLSADTGPFKTTITLEVDGVTNGTAIGVMQLMFKLPKEKLLTMLKRTGIFTDGNTSFGKWVSKQGNLDSYENIAQSWLGSLSSFINKAPSRYFGMVNVSEGIAAIATIVGSMQNEDGSVSSIGRKLVKNPVMITNYGAGMAKVISAFVADRIANIYVELAAMNKDGDTVGIRNKIAAINATLPKYITKIDADEVVDNTLTWVMPYNVERQLSKIITDMYGKTLKEAINNEFGEFIAHRRELVRATTLMFNGFKLRYEAGYSQLVSKANGSLPSKLAIDELNNKLLDSMPMFRGFFSGTNEDGILVMSETNEPADLRNPKFTTTTKLKTAIDVTGIDNKGKPIDSSNTKRLTANAEKKGWKDGGVSGPIKGIQNLDAATMINMLVNNQAINVHDAAIYSIDQVNESGEDFNKQFIDAMNNYSLHYEVNEALKRTLGILADIDSKSAKAGKPTGYMKKLMISTKGNYGYTKIEGRNASPIDMVTFIHNFNNLANANDQVRQELIQTINAVDQYTLGEGTTYFPDTNTDTDTDTTIKGLDDVNPRLLIQHIKALDLSEQDDGSDVFLDNALAKKMIGVLLNMLSKKVPFDVALTRIDNIIIKMQGDGEVDNAYYSEDYFYTDMRRLVTDSLNEDSTSFQKDLFYRDSFGSDTRQQIDPSKFKADISETITNQTAEQVYDSLGKGDPVTDSPEHDSHLRSVLSTMVTSIMKPLKIHLAKVGNSNEGLYVPSTGEIYMHTSTPMPMSALSARMSQREVYVHEILHHLTNSAIDTDSVAANALNALYKAVRDSGKITALTFMEGNYKKGDPGYAAELEVAQERFDYIFGNKITTRDVIRVDPLTGEKVKVKLRNHHNEFLAFGVTNAGFRKALSEITIDSKLKFGLTSKDFKNNLGDSMWSAFMALFTKLVNTVSNMFLGTSNKNADQTLQVLAAQLAGIETRSKNKMWAQAENASLLVHKGATKLTSFATSAYSSVFNSSILKKSRYKSVRQLATIMGRLHHSEGFAKASLDLLDRSGLSPETSNIATDLITELRGQDEQNQTLHQLGRESNKIVDQLRAAIAQAMGKQVLESFTEVLTKDESTALTKLLLKTDLDILFSPDADGNYNYDVDYIVKLLTDTNSVSMEIDAISKKLKTTYKNNGTWYSTMGKNLGHFMAKGKGIYNYTLLNANVIASLDTTHLKAEGDMAAAEVLIDRLATLVAIQQTDSKHRRNAATAITREFTNNAATNGIITTLEMQRVAKKLALDVSFNKGADKKLIQKGYIKEILNPNKAFKIAPASHETLLARKGYTKGLLVRLDENDPNFRDEPQYMYVNENGAPSVLQSGIVSFTNEKSAGQNTLGVYSELGELEPDVAAALDRPQINAAKARVIKAIANGVAKRLKDDEGTLVPTLSSDGNIAEYRYMMEEHRKDSLLDKDNALHTVMGATIANITDKANTAIINNKTVNTLYQQYSKDTQQIRGKYVEIGPNSSQEEYRTIYHMLPQKMRDEINSVWGGESMFVLRDEAALIFGKRKLSVSQLEFIDKNGLKGMKYFKALVHNFITRVFGNKWGVLVESVWQELIKYVKDAIVIKSGIVLLGNVISNILVLKAMGVSFKDIVKNHYKGVKLSMEFEKSLTELTKLEFAQKLSSVPKGTHDARIADLKDIVDNSPIRELYDAAIHQSIIEDVEDSVNANSFQTRLLSSIADNKIGSAVTTATPKFVKTIAKNLVMTHDTGIYEFMKKSTQMSDFASRFVMHEHNKNKTKLTNTESLAQVVDLFINYDLPTNKYLQYGNDMGGLMFTKFTLRIQKVIIQMAKKNPGGLLAQLVLQRSLGIDVPDITDSFIPTAGLAGKLNTDPLDLLMEILDAPMTLVGELFD